MPRVAPKPKKAPSVTSSVQTDDSNPYHRPSNKLLYNRLKKRYRNLGKPLSQNHWAGCGCISACQPETCSCSQDGAPCRQSCSCGPSCEHQFPPCTCSGDRCGQHCPCANYYYQCTDACACSSNNCTDFDNLPATHRKISLIPGASWGLFASEDIAKGAVIGRLEGEVVESDPEPNWDQFDIAKGHALHCFKEGVYYANELPAEEANAAFGYLEGKRRREMVLRAKRSITAGEEITTQYSDPAHEPCFNMDEPEPGSYILITGEGEDKSFEPWLGQVVTLVPGEFLTVDWLLRKQDLHYIPQPLRKTIKLGVGEFLKTKGWRDKIEWESFRQVVWVNGTKPDKELMNTNAWWATRTYDVKKMELF